MQCLQPRFHLPVPQRAQGSDGTAESTWGREGAPGCSSHSSFSSLEFLIFLSSAANPPSRIYLICSSRWGPAAAHQGTGVRGCSSGYRGCSSRYGGQGLLIKVRGQGLLLKVPGLLLKGQGSGGCSSGYKGLLFKVKGCSSRYRV